ncbi:MAG TPA: hypothetical protein VFL85_04730 [Candidatus Saccharimonadales bacterium]|nr:hypothetical protein [Candidatus Saccharimonadales bacterium]
MSFISRNQYPQSPQPEALSADKPASAEQLETLDRSIQALWLAAQAGQPCASYKVGFDGMVASYALKEGHTGARSNTVHLFEDYDGTWIVSSERLRPSREIDPGELIRTSDVFPISSDRTTVVNKIEACEWPRSARTLDERLPKDANSIKPVAVIREGDDGGILNELTAAGMQQQFDAMLREAGAA